MYRVRKRIEIMAAHKLAGLPYESPCSNLHGHNWIIEVEVSAEELNSVGMVIDFTHIKAVVNRLDHQTINHVVEFNPTAENIARWVAIQVTKKLEKEFSAWVTKVTVQESEGNVAEWTPSNTP